ncbi:MAG: hypothetical protein WCO77_10870 [bacterium]
MATEGWAALVNDAGTGIGVCTMSVSEFHGGFAGQRGKGGEKSANTGYMAPIVSEILDHNIVYEYSCSMLLGTLEQIRAEARRMAPKTSPAWTFGNARQGWHCENGRDSGWPLAGGGLKVKANNPTRPVRLVGPITFWRAEAAGEVEVRVSSSAAGRMKIYWRGMPSMVVAKGSDWAAWQAKWWKKENSTDVEIPAGTMKWVSVKLAGLSGYKGGMTGLALDIPDGVTIHDVRLAAGAR